MGQRTCTKCGETKPLGEFHRGGRAKDGRVSRCKACVAEYHRRHYLANRERIIERTNAYQRENPERARGYVAKWNEANRKHRRDYSRAYRAADPERLRRQQEEFRKRHPDKHRQDQQRRRALLAGVAHDPLVTLGSLRARDGDFCCYCGVLMDFTTPDQYDPRRATIEHIMPISRGGGHVFTNTTLSCRRCNISKNNSLFIWEWVRPKT